MICVQPAIGRREGVRATGPTLPPMIATRRSPGYLARRPKRTRRAAGSHHPIAVAVYRHPADFGGMGVAADFFVGALREAGYDVREYPLASATRPLTRLNSFSVEGLRAAVTVLCRTAVALVWRRPALCYYNVAQWGPALWRDVVLLLIHRLAGVKVLVHLHGSALPDRLNGADLSARVLRAALPKRTWLLLAPSVAAAMPPGFLAVVLRNPLPLASRRPTENVTAGPEAPLVVGWLSALIPEKGVDLLFEAARDLSGVRLVVAGPIGRIVDFPPNVEYVGTLPREAALRFWATKDLCVLPSRVPEGVPFTVLEALEGGAAVATSRSASLDEFIDAGAVLAVRPDVASIRALLEELRDPRRRADLTAAQQSAWSEMREDYSPAAVTDRFLATVKTALGTTRRLWGKTASVEEEP